MAIVLIAPQRQEASSLLRVLYHNLIPWTHQRESLEFGNIQFKHSIISKPNSGRLPIRTWKDAGRRLCQ